MNTSPFIFSRRLWFVWCISLLGSCAFAQTLQIHNVPGDFPTIQSAIDGAFNGDCIRVGAGVWSESLTIPAKPLVIQGAGADDCTISAAGFTGAPVMSIVADPHLIIRGFTITGGASSGIQITGNATFEGCRIINNTSMIGAGIHVTNGTITLIDCDLRQNNASVSGGALYVNGGAIYTRHCRFIGNSAPTGAVFFPASATAIVRLVDATVAFNTAATTVIEVNSSPVGNLNVFEGLTYYGNTGDFKNNSIVGAQSISNSIFWANNGQGVGAFSVQYSNIQAAVSGSGVISADPLFVDPQNEDFRLAPGSPCIDSGSPGSTRDLDGSLVDMGRSESPIGLGANAVGNLRVASAGVFPVTDTLMVNMTAALPFRRLSLQVGQSFNVRVNHSPLPSGVPATDEPILLLFSPGVPDLNEQTFLPYLGPFAFDPFSPNVIILADGFSGQGLLGPAYGPFTASFPSGSPIPLIGVLQAVQWKSFPDSGLRLTNAMLVHIY